MKPRPFSYYRPTSLAEALALLAELPDAKVIAGGQSLVAVMNFGLAQPPALLDIGAIPELHGLRWEADGLRLGATTREYEIEDDPQVAAAYPLVHEGVSQIGHRVIRHRGTVGGSLCHCDPAAEWGALATALEATFTLASLEGERTATCEEFFLAPLVAGLMPGELLTAIHLPALPPGTRSTFYEVARRHGDFALVGVAAAVAQDEDGAVNFARVALCGVHPTPLRARAAEAVLLGERPAPALLAAAAAEAAAACEPSDDVHADAAYRRALAGVCVRRALARALGTPAHTGEVAVW